MPHQRYYHRRNTRNANYKQNIVCRHCHSVLIENLPQQVIRIHSPQSGMIIAYKIRANKTVNVTRSNQNLYCVCHRFIGVVNNYRNLNFRYQLNANCVTESVTIYMN